MPHLRASLRHGGSASLAALLPALLLPSFLQASGQAPVTNIVIDVAAGRHPISPYIYGVNFGSSRVLADLGATVNRSGGDSASLYNWRLDARNAGRDWFFESLPCKSEVFDQFGDGFVSLSRSGGARVMLTVPMIGWVARLGPDRSPLASFSIARYGLQQKTDASGFAEAGNGVNLDGQPIRGNDPRDAAQPDGPASEALRLRHTVARWKPASAGGVAFYLLDNEPSQWHLIHRDVQPEGLHAKDLSTKTLAYAAMIRSVDPSAKIVAPEVAGWASFKDSGFDQQQGGNRDAHHQTDRNSQTGGLDLLPWLLAQWKQAGHPIDVVSVHFYPPGGEYRDDGDDESPAMQLKRNQSTRLLWDRNYQDPNWINDKVALIPRLRRWVDQYYHPGTPIALTEYNWGGEKTMNGATTQADLLGIFGREGLYLATRWIAPAEGSPTYLAMKLFRNPDGRHQGFGEISVSASVPQPDDVSAFAAMRTSDKALTVIAINKQLANAAPVLLAFAHFGRAGTVEAIRLTDGKLSDLPGSLYADAAMKTLLPPQSVTLFIFHADGH
jgi:hypothetical protein